MLKSFRDVQIPILTKITVPYMILALLIAVGGGYIITNVIIDSVEERFTNQLIETGLLASESVVREEEELLESLRLISHIQGIGEAVEGGEVDILNQLALPAAYNSNVEVLAILNRVGRELLSVRLNPEEQVYERMLPSEPFARSPLVQSILMGEEDEFGDKYGGLIETQEGTYIFVAGPIEDSRGRLLGVALIGESVEGIAQLVRKETLAQLSIYRLDGSLQTTTLAEGEFIGTLEADMVLARQEEGSMARELVDSGITYNELLLPFEIRGGQDIGIMGVAMPTRFLVQTSQITRTNTIILMTVVLVLVMLVGVFVASRITRPILDLKDAALQVSEGDLSVRVSRSGRDEVSMLAKSFNEMVRNIAQSKKDLIETYDKTIEGWAMALDLRDHATEGHSRRVMELAIQMARKMNIKGEELEHLRRGALLHDIGKIAIPDKILLKKGKLSKKERKIIEQHPMHGKEFMEQIEFLQPALDIPYSHHEKWDGSGYPQGLKGKEIPLSARIFAVVDVWDAITTDRPYRKAMKKKSAKKIIKDASNKEFDPEIVKDFFDLLEKHKKK